jgi:hypothetical protein
MSMQARILCEEKNLLSGWRKRLLNSRPDTLVSIEFSQVIWLRQYLKLRCAAKLLVTLLAKVLLTLFQITESVRIPTTKQCFFCSIKSTEVCQHNFHGNCCLLAVGLEAEWEISSNHFFFSVKHQRHQQFWVTQKTILNQFCDFW